MKPKFVQSYFHLIMNIVILLTYIYPYTRIHTNILAKLGTLKRLKLYEYLLYLHSFPLNVIENLYQYCGSHFYRTLVSLKSHSTNGKLVNIFFDNQKKKPSCFYNFNRNMLQSTMNQVHLPNGTQKDVSSCFKSRAARRRVYECRLREILFSRPKRGQPILPRH